MSVAGTPTAYSEVPWFWSDQYDLKLQIAGISQGYDEIVIRGDPSGKSFAVYYLAGGIVIAVDAINSPRDFLAGKKIVGAKVAIASTALADPKTDVAALVA
jgi:3-phenylpropionate/trans-cinnamate dioxygenase ferredoxin reductase subunit